MHLLLTVTAAGAAVAALTVVRRRCQRLPLGSIVGTLAAALLLGACSFTLHRDFTLKEQGGFRDNVVLSRYWTRGAFGFRNSFGAQAVANVIADQIAHSFWIDRFACISPRLCTTTSEYVHGQADDLDSAINDAQEAPPDCLALTLAVAGRPAYNWTHKGQSNGCIYN
ncbi:MAG: hypothetical protein JWR88_1976 [Pseudonocardia sp.]|nr:hypothetical protein [Pseudonocardia sp.]